MTAPEDAPEVNPLGPGLSGTPGQIPLPAIPPLPLRDPAALRDAWQEKSHKPAAIFAGLASGTLGTTVISVNLTAARYKCSKAEVDFYGNQITGPLCPYVMIPGFNATVVSFILGFALAGVGYAAVYAIVYLSHAVRG